MILDYVSLILVFIPVIILYGLLLYKLHDKMEKLYVSIIYWGLYFYGGIGAASPNVALAYTGYFLIFMSVFVFFYRLRYMLPHVVKNAITNFNDNRGNTIFENSSLNNVVIFVYLFFCFTSLLYPTFTIGNLLHPPVPDIKAALLASIDNSAQNVDVLSKILGYFKLLLYPLYLLSLSKFLKRPLILFLLLSLPLYIDYCSTGYIGRGMILIDMGVWLFSVYVFNKKLRVPLVIGIIVLTPIALILLYTYSLARLGNTVAIKLDSSFIAELFYQEINFPENFKAIVDSGKHIDFPGFILWLVTLPFPKFLIGGIDVPLINFELAEIVLGVNRNSDSYYVILSGYISESYYIFGKYFFWVEALMVAWLAKTIFYFLRNIKGSGVLIFYVAIEFGFMFARAGLGSLVPILTNSFLALYVYFALKIHFAKQKLPGQL